MKPRIFLCHSKKDKTFVTNLANDLRNIGNDVWFDEWEIPPGESFIDKMMEGIEDCDVFFIYLTENSIASHWVQKELDAGFIKEYERRFPILATFVDEEETREKLPLKLKPLHSPVLNEKEFKQSFGQIITKAWKNRFVREFDELESKFKTRLLELENENLKLKADLDIRAQQSDIDTIIKLMLESVIEIKGHSLNLIEIFKLITDKSAVGINNSDLTGLILRHLSFETPTYIQTNDIFHKLVTFGILKVERTENTQIKHLINVYPDKIYDYTYFLTELGSQVIIAIMKRE